MSDRIIKLRQPIKRVTVLTLENSNPGETAQNKKPPEELVQLSQSDFQHELQFYYQKGLEEGKLAGYQQAEADFTKKSLLLEALQKEIETKRDRVFRESEDQLLQFTLRVIEKILNETPPFLPNLLKKSLENVLELVSSEPVLEIYLNPEDLGEFEETRTEFEAKLPNLTKLTVKADPRITRGGCLVDTNTGKIDARLETQITKLMTELRKELEQFGTAESE